MAFSGNRDPIESSGHTFGPIRAPNTAVKNWKQVLDLAVIAVLSILALGTLMLAGTQLPGLRP
jgi:hypothetical protein